MKVTHTAYIPSRHIYHHVIQRSRGRRCTSPVCLSAGTFNGAFTAETGGEWRAHTHALSLLRTRTHTHTHIHSGRSDKTVLTGDGGWLGSAGGDEAVCVCSVPARLCSARSGSDCDLGCLSGCSRRFVPQKAKIRRDEAALSFPAASTRLSN